MDSVSSEKAEGLHRLVTRVLLEFGTYTGGSRFLDDGALILEGDAETGAVRVALHMPPEWDSTADKVQVLYVQQFAYGRGCEAYTYRPGAWEKRLAEMSAKALAQRAEQDRKTQAEEAAKFAPINDAALFPAD